MHFKMFKLRQLCFLAILDICGLISKRIVEGEEAVERSLKTLYSFENGSPSLLSLVWWAVK